MEKVHKIKAAAKKFFSGAIAAIGNFFKKKIFKDILWQLYDKSGIRLIYEKFNPPIEKENYRKPSSLLLWIIGIYSAFYGIAETRYEHWINKIDTHANNVIAQLGTPNYKKALAYIPEIQNRKVPYEPQLFKPISVFYTFMESKDTTYNEIVERMKGIVVIWKDSLTGVNLSHAHLEKADLREAHLEKADLREAHLENANLENANLENANLENANLENANLENANLENANLEYAVLSSSNLKHANLIEAHLENNGWF